ncbi:MAG TPA: hypothetical protein VJK00_06755, partial [Steroidobacteraceae bacterium]|nr:hypothetical protein [Steroidobacteraceae bacterium]
MTSSLSLKLLMFRRAIAAVVSRAFACAADADNLSPALAGGASAAADNIERTSPPPEQPMETPLTPLEFARRARKIHTHRE